MYTEQQTNCYKKKKKQNFEETIHEGAHLGLWGLERALLRKPQGDYLCLVYSPPMLPRSLAQFSVYSRYLKSICGYRNVYMN